VLGRLGVHVFRRYPFRCLGYLAALAAGVAMAVFFMSRGHEYLALLGVAVSGVVVYRLLLWWLRMRYTTLTITSKRCILESGIFTRQTAELLKNDLADVQIQQNFFQRLVDIGDVVLVSKPGEPQRLVIMAVHSPEVVANQIRAGVPA